VDGQPVNVANDLRFFSKNPSGKETLILKWRYPVTIPKDPKSDYSMNIPDLHGHLSSGKALAEAWQGSFRINYPSNTGIYFLA
jgi:hypothetical protein